MARRTRLPPPEALDRKTLEQAARLLLGDKWKRPLAKLLGPYHPNGPMPSIDPRLPFRWMMEPPEDTKAKWNGRPIPEWVWPVLRELLHERALDLASQSREAQRLYGDLGVLIHEAERKR